MKRIMLALTLPAALILSGCTSSEPEADTRSSTTSTINVLDGLALPTETGTPRVTTAPQSSSASAKPLGQGIYGVTPDGLTTAVNAPILLSPAELTQGCMELKAWANSIGITDSETLLALTQMTEADSTEGFTVTEGEQGPWADQPPSDQAAAIAMVNAAMSGEC